MSSYPGNCHCGAVRFTLTLDKPIESEQVIRCNCSICTKNGYLIVHPPRSHTVITQGADDIGKYQFGNKVVEHKFCTKCGSSLFIDPPASIDVLAVNVRMLKDFDLNKLDYKDHDGWNNGQSPPYHI